MQEFKIFNLRFLENLKESPYQMPPKGNFIQSWSFNFFMGCRKQKPKSNYGLYIQLHTSICCNRTLQEWFLFIRIGEASPKQLQSPNICLCYIPYIYLSPKCVQRQHVLPLVVIWQSQGTWDSYHKKIVSITLHKN